VEGPAFLPPTFSYAVILTKVSARASEQIRSRTTYVFISLQSRRCEQKAFGWRSAFSAAISYPQMIQGFSR
jgi:hypothetical protein